MFELENDAQKLVLKPGALKYEPKLRYEFTITTEYRDFIYDQKMSVMIQDVPGIPFAILQ